MLPSHRDWKPFLFQLVTNCRISELPLTVACLDPSLLNPKYDNDKDLSEEELREREAFLRRAFGALSSAPLSSRACLRLMPAQARTQS